jgi:hypothetical protein
LTLSLRETAGWRYDRFHYFNVADGHVTLLVITHNHPTPACA